LKHLENRLLDQPVDDTRNTHSTLYHYPNPLWNM
jgi:hypothetical protein